jgi:hypothetical protein
MGNHLIGSLAAGRLAHLGVGSDQAAHDRLETPEESLHQGGGTHHDSRSSPLFARIG